MINFPEAPEEYNAQYQSELIDNLRELDQSCVKVGEDNYLEVGSIVLKDTVNNNYYKLKVSSGSLSVTQVTTDQTANPYA